MTQQADASGKTPAPEPKPNRAHRALELLWGYSKLTVFVGLILFALVSWKEIRQLIPRISRVEALGVKLEVSQLQDALQKQAKSVRSPVQLPAGAVDNVLARAVRVRAVFDGATILWIDDEPQNNIHFRQVLRGLGAGVEPARSTQEALDLAAVNQFDLLVSDIGRKAENGIDGLSKLRAAGVTAQAIFYVAQVDRTRPVPETALGITNRPDELLHLVIDGLERTRWSSLEGAAQPAAPAVR